MWNGNGAVGLVWMLQYWTQYDRFVRNDDECFWFGKKKKRIDLSYHSHPLCPWYFYHGHFIYIPDLSLKNIENGIVYRWILMAKVVTRDIEVFQHRSPDLQRVGSAVQLSLDSFVGFPSVCSVLKVSVSFARTDHHERKIGKPMPST